MAVATSLLPLLIRFLGDSHDETSSSVMSFTTAILQIYKKEKKRAGGDGSSAMTSERKMFLKELVKVTVAKMEYKADVDWSIAIEGEEDEDDLQFAEMRKVCMLFEVERVDCLLVARFAEPSSYRRRHCFHRYTTLLGCHQIDSDWNFEPL